MVPDECLVKQLRISHVDFILDDPCCRPLFACSDSTYCKYPDHQGRYVKSRGQYKDGLEVNLVAFCILHKLESYKPRVVSQMAKKKAYAATHEFPVTAEWY